MKPLVLLLSALVLLPSSLQAQTAPDSLKELKKKYAGAGQRPEAALLASAEAPQGAAGPEMRVEDLERLLLMSPLCKVRPEEKAALDDGLKGKYGIVTCAPAGGVQVIVIVPRSVSPDQQVRYQGFPDRKLLGGRLFDHYLVLDFEGQSQYLDLLRHKPSVGFELSGYFDGSALVEFLTLGSFMDALKHYAGFSEAELSDFIVSAMSVGGRGTPYRLDGRKEGSSWILTRWTDGQTHQVWPVRKPKDAPRR